jgi:hypothetical protein
MQQRRFTRIPFDTKVFIKVNDQSFTASSMNISIRGMFIKTREILSMGDAVELEVVIPTASQGSLMRMSGNVVRLAGDGAGIEFSKMDPEGFQHLKTVLNRRTPHRLKPYMGS